MLVTDRPLNSFFVVENLHNVNPLFGLCCVGYRRDNDCAWGEALRQLAYKCKWHERTLTAIDRWFPSSKRCSSCGYILDKLPLSVRKWTCPQSSCRTTHLRDVNAAKNILAVGQTVIACGLSNGGEVDILSLAILE